MIPRLLGSVLKDARKSILLLGPRQVGKSTLIKSLKPELSINLADEQTYIDFKSNPSELQKRLAIANAKTIFIDEIQMHPPLLGTIQVLIDNSKGKDQLKFYLSGSSARKLRRGGANLLPGRVLSYEIGSLCAAEVDYKLDIERAMKLGTLPEMLVTKESAEVQKLLTSYAGTYLKEEIQAEALTRNLDGYSRFLFAAAQSAGQILDFSKIAKRAKIERKLCTRFYEILEDTLIATRVEAFDKVDVEIVKRPKFYFFDTGVLNGFQKNFEVSDDRRGFLFEHLVVNQILNSARARDISIQLFYFRTRSGHEIDFILQMNSKLFAIEVKSGIVDSGDIQSVRRAISELPQLQGVYLVGPGADQEKVSDIQLCDLNFLIKDLGL